ncbi:MAG: hypothetical protein JJU10_01385 [Idiomarina sp.]|nr:hypothetical protein [Idiomarina sp.]
MSSLFRVFCGFALLTFASASSTLHAAPEDDGREPISLGFELKHRSTANLNQLGSGFRYTEYAVDFERHALLFEADHRDVRWTLGDTPRFGNLTRIAPGFQLYQEIPPEHADNWAVWFKLMVYGGYESSFTSDSITFNPQFILLNFQPDERVLYLGLGRFFHPVDPIAYPILGFAWQETPGRTWSGAIGFPETMVRYRLSNHWSVRANFEFDYRYYQLGQQNTTAAGGFLQTKELIPALQLEWRPIPESDLLLYLGVEYLIEREHIFYDANRNRVFTDRTASGSAIRIGTQLRF